MFNLTKRQLICFGLGGVTAVKILGCNSIYNKDDFIKVITIWVSPDEKYLIIERYKSDLYLSARILEKTEELRRTIVGRDKLYSVIAHDLRSPLASI